MHDTTKATPIVPALLTRRQARRPTRTIAGTISPLPFDTTRLATQDSTMMVAVGQCRAQASKAHVPVPVAPIPPVVHAITNEQQVEVIMLGQQLAACQAALVHRGIPLQALRVQKARR